MQYKQVPSRQTRTAKSSDQELAQYMASEDVLEPDNFWYKYKSEFPPLTLLYTKVLCCSLGSPVERVFSVAGNILRPRRSRMNSKLVCAL